MLVLRWYTIKITDRCCMRGSLLLCLLGAATSFVWEPRRLVLQAMPPRVSYKQQVKNLLARGNDSGYTLPNEDEPLTPERFAAEILKLPGCRAWASLNRSNFRLSESLVLVPGDEKRPYKPYAAEEKLAALSPDDALAGSSRRSVSAEIRKKKADAAPAHQPDPKRSASNRERVRQEREAEELRTRVLASPDPRALDVLQAPENPANSACYNAFLAWTGSDEDAKQVAPDLPGFPESFFAARGHKNGPLRRAINRAMLVGDWVMRLRRGAEKERTISRAENAQACLCLGTVGSMVRDPIGMRVKRGVFFICSRRLQNLTTNSTVSAYPTVNFSQCVERAFGVALLRDKEYLVIDGAAASKLVNNWVDALEENKLNAWATNVGSVDGGLHLRGGAGDEDFAIEKNGGRKGRWFDDMFSDFFPQSSCSGLDLPVLDTPPDLVNGKPWLAQLRRGAQGWSGHLTVSTSVQAPSMILIVEKRPRDDRVRTAGHDRT